MRSFAPALLATTVLALAGCGGDEPAPTREGRPPVSTTAAPPVLTVAEGDEIPALPSGDVTVPDEAAADRLCARLKDDPEPAGGRRQVTIRAADAVDGIVCLLPR